MVGSWERIPSFTKKQEWKAGVEVGSEPEWSASDRVEMTGAGTCRGKEEKQKRENWGTAVSEKKLSISEEWKQSWQNIVNVELKNVLIRQACSLKITAGKLYILLNSNHSVIQIPLKTKIYLILDWMMYQLI